MHNFLIWSFEHQAWWKPGRMGYTELIQEAGRYSEAEADEIVANANRYAKQAKECKVAVPEIPVIDSFTCPRCHRTSAHPMDARDGYCGACHDWTGPRYGVVSEHNFPGGFGWTLIDRQRRMVTGGWFADRVAADRTAHVLNADEGE